MGVGSDGVHGFLAFGEGAAAEEDVIGACCGELGRGVVAYALVCLDGGIGVRWWVVWESGGERRGVREIYPCDEDDEFV